MKKYVCIVVCISLITLSAAALDLGDLVYEVTSSRTENGQQVFEGVDQYGNELTLVGTENLTDASRKSLQVMLSTFNAWKYLVIGTQRVVITEERTEMALIPESFVYKDINLAEFMPSGMQFYYTTYLEYDFRFYKDRLFLRMSGQLFDEEQFCKKLVQALENPVLYIQSHNPDYILEQIGMISAELEKTQQDLASFREEYEALAADHEALQGEYEALAADHKVLQGEYDLLESGHNTLVEEYNLLRNAVTALSNDGLFKLLEPIGPETVDEVIQAKRASPDIPSKDLASQLKDQGIDISSKAVAIIFAVYFNDFEQ